VKNEGELAAGQFKRRRVQNFRHQKGYKAAVRRQLDVEAGQTQRQSLGVTDMAHALLRCTVTGCSRVFVSRFAHAAHVAGGKHNLTSENLTRNSRGFEPGVAPETRLVAMATESLGAVPVQRLDVEGTTKEPGGGAHSIAPLGNR